MILTVLDWLGWLAAFCTLAFAWAISVLLFLGAMFVAYPELDFSGSLRLRRAAEYTLFIAVVFGAGALCFGVCAGLWAVWAALSAAAQS